MLQVWYQTVANTLKNVTVTYNFLFSNLVVSYCKQNSNIYWSSANLEGESVLIDDLSDQMITISPICLKIHIVSTVQIFFQHLNYAGFAPAQNSQLPWQSKPPMDRSFPKHQRPFQMGEKDRASGKCWSVKTKVRKQKYGNGSTEVRRKATYQYLVPYYLDFALQPKGDWLQA